MPICSRLLLVFGLLLLLAACGKKNSTLDTSSYVSARGLDTAVHISAKINGVPFVTDSVNGYRVRYSSDSGKADLMINATIASAVPARSIRIVLNNYSGPATYPLAPPFNAAWYYHGTARFAALSGSVVVTKDSVYGIIGTFSFVADTFQITEGEFDVAQP